ncbi:MAG TPA: DNA translocase FtsK 4TM domain-containing protein, partial [Patescibacteria group bacterium]|nr:DNA translocase FtsK 4TM domain-containing protein [Patescibacteria group bacterium]
MYKGVKNYFRGANYLGLFLFIISIQPLLHFFYNQKEALEAAQAGNGGGYIGMQLASFFQNILGFWGGLVILLCLFVISILLIFNTTLVKVVGEESIIAKLFYPFKLITKKFFSRKEEDEREEEEEDEREEAPVAAEEEEGSHYRGEVESGFSFQKKGIQEKQDEGATDMEMEKESLEEEEGIFEYTASNIKIDLPLELLDNRVGKPVSGNTRKNSLVIQRTMENFGIPVEMGEASVGPTITRYTFKPAEGIKLSRVTALSNDLALALAAHPIRIEAPIPGRSLVGIEVPNKAKAIISLREILSSKEYKKEKGHLKVALGRDVTGKTWLYDITKMPH